MAEMRQFTIVLVEDDDGHAQLVERNLRRGGMVNRLVRLADGQEAVDYLWRQGDHAERPPTGPLLVLLDIRLPKVDGTEVLRRMKADEQVRTVPVIMLTTTDDPREVQRCYELGCSVYIVKPLDYLRFVEVVRELGLFLAVVALPAEPAVGGEP